MSCLRNKINLAKCVIMNHLEMYITGWVLLVIGLLVALFSHDWVIAVISLILYVIYTIFVDLYILGYIPVNVNLDYSNCDLSGCVSSYEYEETEEDREWEDEENIYSRDDDVEEEYEDENYNEDEDEFEEVKKGEIF